MRVVRTAFITGLTLILGAIAPAAARAQVKDLTHEVAKKHYELGEQLYQTSSYTEALAEFEKAYKLQPYPELLFNIARCHEVTARLDEAMRYYRLFLAQQPDTPRRPLVEARLATLSKRLAAEREARERRPAAAALHPSPAPSPVAPTPEPSDGGGGWKRTTGWVALGLGAAALVTGVVCGALASGKADDFTAAAAAGRPYEELDAIDASGKRLELVQIVTLIVGGVAAAGGGGLLLWHHLGRPREARGAASLTPLLGGGAVGLSGTLRF